MKVAAILMRRIGLGLVFYTALIAAPASAFDSTQAPQAAVGTLQPLFAPWDDIETALIDALDAARQQVLVQAYLLSNHKIAAALIAAKRRGVDVKVMLDGRQLEKVGASKARELAAAGIPLWLESGYQNAHNKVMVIDSSTAAATVITGSFNFTWSAQHKNAENVLIVRNNPALAMRYALNWERHRLDATPYKTQ
ncbi:putative endonuclease protein [Collimonas arenae]|uniref:phospholipase D n=1 Tax=Collimonas arenae TaxID=279058 RepID=A0A0A1FIK3_9BURK|nr:phospholipase D-like domain-containing protein [Collimonas arenae]AIY42697.1 putative endonuclease protein [Collimonas arenae]